MIVRYIGIGIGLAMLAVFVGMGVAVYLHFRQPSMPRAKTRPIADHRGGAYGKIVGTVEVATDVLVAPISGRRCVCYDAWVEQYTHKLSYESVSMGRHSRQPVPQFYWHPLPYVAERRDFLVRDATGVARVEVGAAVILSRTGPWTEATQPTPGLLGVLQRVGVSHQGALRYHEGVIEVGDRVAVTGVLGTEPDPTLAATGVDYRSAATVPTRRVLRPGPRSKLFVTNRDEALG